MDMMAACMGGMGVLGILFPLALLAVLALGIVLVIRQVQGAPRLSPATGRADDRALVLLRERYARGEIGREEYEERRRTLAAGEPGWP